MSVDKLQKELLTRRSFVLGTAKLGLLSALIGRLFYLQVIEGKKYQTLADENRIATRYLLPERGMIVDRFGKPLALTKDNYRLLFMPEQISFFKESVNDLSALISCQDLNVSDCLKNLRKNPNQPITLKDDLSWEEVIKIETKIADLPGIQIEKYKKRLYVHGPVLCSILGYIGPLTQEEQEKIENFCTPEQRIGKSGIEKQYDEILRGTFGIRTVEVNARGRIVRELNETPPLSGQPMTLTIDYDLQNFAYERLGDMPAASVTLDVQTGEVLSLISSPNYDPHLFLNGIKSEDWKNLSTQESSPLINRVIQGYYPPGSIFKTAVALAGLEKGIISPSERISCCGHIDYGQHKFHCWASKTGHGALNLIEALQYSCDIYFYQMAERMGIETIAKMAQKLGLGSPTGIDLPNERAGLVPTPSWKKKRFKQAWHKGETMMIGIGQSYLLATPLQLAIMMARIANGGKKIIPRLHQDYIDQGIIKPIPLQEPESLNIAPEHIKIVLEALNRVTNMPGGTGYRSRITEKGFEMAGKSSTAQVKSITLEDRQKGLYKNENRPWHERDHALFAGFAPVHNPRFVNVTIIEHGGSGSKAAAPVVKDILLKTQQLAQSRAEIQNITESEKA